MRLHDDVSRVATEYGVVLLDERRGSYWQLSPMGALVVEHLEQDREFDDVVNAITSRFAVSDDTARQDVTAFVHSLRTAGLVKS